MSYYEEEEEEEEEEVLIRGLRVRKFFIQTHAITHLLSLINRTQDNGIFIKYMHISNATMCGFHSQVLGIGYVNGHKNSPVEFTNYFNCTYKVHRQPATGMSKSKQGHTSI